MNESVDTSASARATTRFYSSVHKSAYNKAARVEVKEGGIECQMLLTE